MHHQEELVHVAGSGMRSLDELVDELARDGLLDDPRVRALADCAIFLLDEFRSGASRDPRPADAVSDVSKQFPKPCGRSGRRDWLERQLARGSLLRSAVLERALEHGFSERSLQRDLQSLGGDSKPTGYGDESEWFLPRAARPVTAGAPFGGTVLSPQKRPGSARR